MLRDARWPAIGIAVGLLAIVGFLHDLGIRHLESWAIAAAMVAGTAISVLVLPREGLPRALIWFGAVLVAAFLILYNVLDAILDPLIRADWPIAGLSIALILGLETALTIIVSNDD